MLLFIQPVVVFVVVFTHPAWSQDNYDFGYKQSRQLRPANKPEAGYKRQDTMLFFVCTVLLEEGAEIANQMKRSPEIGVNTVWAHRGAGAGEKRTLRLSERGGLRVAVQ